jgi:hypothetical protein
MGHTDGGGLFLRTYRHRYEGEKRIHAERLRRKPRRAAEVSGRTWDRNEPTPDRLEPTQADFERLLQGLLVDAEGRPISLSTTAFHSLGGRIWDRLAGSEAVRELALAVLRELVGR